MGSVTRGRVIVATLAAALALPSLALALPHATSAYLLGPRMTRADIALRTKDGVTHDYWLDRGRLAKRYSGGSLVIVERDRTATQKTAANARVWLNGKVASVRALRAGMQVVVQHDRELPADTVYAASKGAPKLPAGALATLLGPRMLRAEIPLQSVDGVNHDFRLDQGKLRQVAATSVVVREADGTNVTIDVSQSARVKLNGQPASYFQLKRGMSATVIHDGDKPADQIYAAGK
jgi:hypothetical protein